MVQLGGGKAARVREAVFGMYKKPLGRFRNIRSATPPPFQRLTVPGPRSKLMAQSGSL
jgi:hypothetical protein